MTRTPPPLENAARRQESERKFDPRPLIPSLASGLVIGLVEIVISISFGALIFDGSLAGYLPLGIGLGLLGAILSTTIITLFTSLPGTIGGNQDVPAAIMALIAASIIATIPAGATTQETGATVLAAIALTTLLTGAFFLALGYFRLGSLVRFLPYPVIGGFLAGTAWLLASGAMSLMVTLPQGLAQLPALLQPQMIIYWLPGVFMALAILFLSRRSDNLLVIPVVLVIFVILFYLVAWSAGYSPALLSSEGLLLGPFPEGGLWRPFSLASLNQVNWPTIAGQAANIGAILLVSAVGLLLNAGGVELATKKDMDLNRELRVAGLANLLSGLVPGFVGYQQLSLSAMTFKLRADNRLTGLISAFLCVLALFFGASLLSLVPKAIIGGLLLFLGLSFLVEWVIESWSRLPKIDYFIVIAILLVTIFIGFLEAVALGLLLAIILFVVGYSRVEIVRNEFTRTIYKSRVTRPRQQEQVLRREGERLYILQLQGFVFFGTADRLLNQVRQRLANAQQSQPLAVILDFQRVTGLDSTGTLSFNRMKQLTAAKGTTLVFTGPSPAVRHQLEQNDLGEDGDSVRFFANLDEGIQWGENLLLVQELKTLSPNPVSLLEHLADLVPEEGHLETLIGYFERLKLAKGQTLIALDDPPEDLFLVETGQVTAQIPQPGQAPLRLQTMGSGHMVGEIGFCLGHKRTAEVLADEPSIVYRLSLADYERMRQNDPEAAAALQRFIARVLAERVIHLTDVVRTLHL